MNKTSRAWCFYGVDFRCVRTGVKRANVDNDIAVWYNYDTETGCYIKQKILGYDSVIRRSINTDKYSDIMRW